MGKRRIIYQLYPPHLETGHYIQSLESAVSVRAVPPELLYWTPLGAHSWCHLANVERQGNVYPLSHQARRAVPVLMDDILNEMKEHTEADGRAIGIAPPIVISLGPGEGIDDAEMINRIAARFDVRTCGPFHYYLLDVSYPMLACASGRILKSCPTNILKNFNLRWVHARFADLPQIKGVFRNRSKTPALFCLLGHTLGNFKEDPLLPQICEAMSVNDFLLLGVDCLLPEAVEAKDKAGVEFLENPLHDLSKQYPGILPKGAVHPRIISTENSGYRRCLSLVPGARTIAYIYGSDGGINEWVLSVSHKYNADMLEIYLRRWFTVVKRFDPTPAILQGAPGARYTLFLLKKPPISREDDRGTHATELIPQSHTSPDSCADTERQQLAEELESLVQGAATRLNRDLTRRDDLSKKIMTAIQAGGVPSEKLRQAITVAKENDTRAYELLRRVWEVLK